MHYYSATFPHGNILIQTGVTITWYWKTWNLLFSDVAIGHGQSTWVSFKLLGNGICYFDCTGSKYFYFKVGLSRLRKFLPNQNFPQSCWKKIPSFVCLVLQIENKWILKLQNLFFWKTDWFEKNCTRLWRFILMTTYMLTQEYYFS